MSEDENNHHVPVDGLTPEELAVLRNVLKRLEWHVLEAVVRRLKLMVLLAAGVLTVFGIASIATIRSAIVEAAAEKLASRSDIREAVVADASENLQHVNDVLQKAKKYDAEITYAKGQALTAISADLDDVIALVAQLKSRAEQRLQEHEKTDGQPTQ